MTTAITMLATVIGTWIGGTVLLSLEFGWKVGLGIGLLVMFHKSTK